MLMDIMHGRAKESSGDTAGFFGKTGNNVTTRQGFFGQCPKMSGIYPPSGLGLLVGSGHMANNLLEL
jgi:hypothetical protein